VLCTTCASEGPMKFVTYLNSNFLLVGSIQMYIQIENIFKPLGKCKS
jgi:hypothetical protein